MATAAVFVETGIEVCVGETEIGAIQFTSIPLVVGVGATEYA